MDASTIEEAKRTQYLATEGRRGPLWAKGQIVLVAVCGIPEKSAVISDDQVSYMFESFRAIETVKGLADPQVERTLEAIRRLRRGEKRRGPEARRQPADGTRGGAERRPRDAAESYWLRHAVVYADVRAAHRARG